MSAPIFVVVLTAALAFFIVAWAYEFEPPRRFWKPRAPHQVQVPGKPGSVIELVADDGHVYGVVVLSRITHSRHDGTSVVFEDYSRYLADRRINHDDDW